MLSSPFLYGPKETIETKVTKTTSPAGFQQLCVTVSSADTHLHIHLLIPTFKRKTLCKKCYGFTRLFTSQRYSLTHFIFPFQS